MFLSCVVRSWPRVAPSQTTGRSPPLIWESWMLRCTNAPTSSCVEPAPEFKCNFTFLPILPVCQFIRPGNMALLAGSRAMLQRSALTCTMHLQTPDRNQGLLDVQQSQGCRTPWHSVMKTHSLTMLLTLLLDLLPSMLSLKFLWYSTPLATQLMEILLMGIPPHHIMIRHNRCGLSGMNTIDAGR